MFGKTQKLDYFNRLGTLKMGLGQSEKLDEAFRYSENHDFNNPGSEGLIMVSRHFPMTDPSYAVIMDIIPFKEECKSKRDDHTCSSDIEDYMVPRKADSSAGFIYHMVDRDSDLGLDFSREHGIYMKDEDNLNPLMSSDNIERHKEIGHMIISRLKGRGVPNYIYGEIVKMAYVPSERVFQKTPLGKPEETYDRMFNQRSPRKLDISYIDA